MLIMVLSFNMNSNPRLTTIPANDVLLRGFILSEIGVESVLDCANNNGNNNNSINDSINNNINNSIKMIV